MSGTRFKSKTRPASNESVRQTDSSALPPAPTFTPLDASALKTLTPEEHHEYLVAQAKEKMRHGMTNSLATELLDARPKDSGPEVAVGNTVRREEGKESSGWRKRLALVGLLFVGAVLVFTLALRLLMPPAFELSSLRPDGADRRLYQSKPLTFDERVEKHKRQVGEKLNRDRINAELDAFKTMPAPLPAIEEEVEDRVLTGLPLNGEKHHRIGADPSPYRERGILPDVHTYDELYEQQYVDDWNRKVEEQYIQDFVANARRAGYQLRIDKNYNVEAYKLPPGTYDRMPQSEGFYTPVGPSEAGPSRSGLAR